MPVTLYLIMETDGAWVVGRCFQEQFLVYFRLGPP